MTVSVKSSAWVSLLVLSCLIIFASLRREGFVFQRNSSMWPFPVLMELLVADVRLLFEEEGDLEILLSLRHVRSIFRRSTPLHGSSTTSCVAMVASLLLH